jgi:drug/metabolite transporter (DMT)-like permease
VRTALLAATALLGFAANSLLCRLALRSGEIDAASFTAIRLASGAIVLALLMTARTRALPRGGTWRSAGALAAYAVLFSFAYLELSAGTGALLLFGSVQLTMIAGALMRGERPSPLQWIGWLVALAGLVVLTAPGIDPPPPLAAALMLGAGIAWGIYTLRGRGVTDPLAATAGNFARTLPLVLVLAAIAIAQHAPLSARGVLLAIASGGLASGLGYSLWYAAVPALGATRAAAIQLAVPVLTAMAGIALLGESLRIALAIGGSAIVLGLALALVRGPRARARDRSRGGS